MCLGQHGMSQRSERKKQNRQTIIDTVLMLSHQGQSFHTISLRQLAKEVGIVPSALYRYFQNKDILAQATIDQVSVLIKSTLLQSRTTFYKHPDSIEYQLNLFLDQVSKYAIYWHFFVSELWGGYSTLEETIYSEVDNLTIDLMKDLKKLETYQHATDEQLYIFSELLLQLLLVWSKEWIKLSQAGAPAESYKQSFVQGCQKKISFLRQPIKTSAATLSLAEEH